MTFGVLATVRGGFSAPVPEAEGVDSIDRFQIGVSISHGLEVGAELHAKSSQDSEKLTAVLGMIGTMVKAQKTGENGSNFDLQVENGTLKSGVDRSGR